MAYFHATRLADRLLLVSASMLLGLSTALANPAADRQAPTTIDADALRYDDLKQTTVFSGSVVLTKGSLTLRADRLELREAPSGDQYAIATGSSSKRVQVRQRRTGTDEWLEGEAERVDYDGRNERLIFTGQAQVRRLACGVNVDEVRGQQITYYQRSETYTATGGGQQQPGGRVRTVIQPRGSEATDATPTPCPPVRKGQ